MMAGRWKPKCADTTSLATRKRSLTPGRGPLHGKPNTVTSQHHPIEQAHQLARERYAARVIT